MALKQNAIDNAEEFPMASEAVQESFYVDDCLSGADSVEEATKLQRELHNLFRKGSFLLHNGILTLQAYSDTYLTSTKIHSPCM